VTNSGIYQIKNTISRKCYIGSAGKLSRRWIEHRASLNKNQHHSRHLQRAWHKYGESAFEFIILELVEIERLLEREQFFIDLLLPEYNTCPVAGSPRGVKHTSEARRNMSVAHLGQKLTTQQRQKQSASMKRVWATDLDFRKRCNPLGRILKPESKQKISDSLKGQRHGPERRRKISETLKTRWATPEYRQLMTAAHVGNKATPETRRRMSEAQKLRWQREKQK
jgi:group I intron endonuclease